MNYVVKRIDNIVLVLLGPSFSLGRDGVAAMGAVSAELDNAEAKTRLRIITDWTAAKPQTTIETAHAGSHALTGGGTQNALWSHPRIESIWHVNPGETVKAGIAEVQTPPFKANIRVVDSLYAAVSAALPQPDHDSTVKEQETAMSGKSGS